MAMLVITRGYPHKKLPENSYVRSHWCRITSGNPATERIYKGLTFHIISMLVCWRVYCLGIISIIFELGNLFLTIQYKGIRGFEHCGVTFLVLGSMACGTILFRLFIIPKWKCRLTGSHSPEFTKCFDDIFYGRQKKSCDFSILNKSPHLEMTLIGSTSVTWNWAVKCFYT